MKGKNMFSKPATKADLELALKKFATKKELKAVADQVTQQLRGEIKASADETVKKLEDTIIGVKDIIMETMDSFAKEIEENREDRIIAAHQTAQIQKQVDLHEKRIKQLEKTQQVA